MEAKIKEKIDQVLSKFGNIYPTYTKTYGSNEHVYFVAEKECKTKEIRTELEILLFKLNRKEIHILYNYNTFSQSVEILLMLSEEMSEEETLKTIQNLEYGFTLIDLFKTSEKQTIQDYCKKMSSLA